MKGTKQKFEEALQLTNAHIISQIEMNFIQNSNIQEEDADQKSFVFKQAHELLSPDLPQPRCQDYLFTQFKRVHSDVRANSEQRYKFHPISQVLGSKKSNCPLEHKIAVPSLIFNRANISNLNDSIQSNLEELTKNNSKCFIMASRFESQNSKSTKVTASTSSTKPRKPYQCRHRPKCCVLGQNVNYLY